MWIHYERLDNHNKAKHNKTVCIFLGIYCISIEAKDRTAELFRHINPQAADLIIESSYVDDIVDSVPSLEVAKKVTHDADLILSKGGFKVKGWLFGGDDVSAAKNEVHQVLGVSWIASENSIVFQVSLNLSPKRRNLLSQPDLDRTQIPAMIPDILTRRMVLQQVMRVFDPCGFFVHFMVIAKVYLRETWILKLGWDEPLPEELCLKWREFFTQMFDMEDHKFSRYLKPKDAVGDPTLVIFSDGSKVAYGCAAYIRWTLVDGSFWCRLVLAKCRIAPINRISIPQMELNGAVLSKRCRKVIEAECRFKFLEVYHFVDSETILSMINKLSTRFRVYEGVRIGEIQASTDGDVSCWGWVSSENNITRGQPPSQLGPDSKWQKGPDFLNQSCDQWNAKFSPSSYGPLPGENSVKVKSHSTSISEASVSRCSSMNILKWVYARIIVIFMARSFKGGNRTKVTPEYLSASEPFLFTQAQSVWSDEENVKYFYSTRWIVGSWVVHLWSQSSYSWQQTTDFASSKSPLH